ncbi:MAG: hypothetical protein Q9185_007154 [Variospora sp. 1 TL-2023]
MERSGSPWLRTDAARERELFRYFDPPDPTRKAPTRATRYSLSIGEDDSLADSPPSSPEITLTALAQLCAIRLNASRAMISVIGKDTQYFIAEATKTLDLVDNQHCDDEADALWVGCGSVDKSGRLCEKTIELPASPDAYPCFTVTDLSQDDRFNTLPFVTGPPKFRFYAGTPLTTKRGVNIGSLFVLDDKVRPRLTPAQEKILGTIAATIMGHMEVNREAEERRKILRMANALNAFVEGKSSFNAGDETEESTPSGPVDDGSYETESTHSNIEGAHKATFSRAADLLNHSLNLRNHGGVCFLDTITGALGMAVKQSEQKAPETESESDEKESWTKARRGLGRNIYDLSGCRPSGEPTNIKKAEVISASCARTQSRSAKGSSTRDPFVPPDERFVQTLLKHYPRGKVWIFDDGLTWEEDDMPSPSAATVEGQRRRRLPRKQLEKEILRKCFPDGGPHICKCLEQLIDIYSVNELIFVPLWDAGTSRWFSGCFCWKTSLNRSLSIEAELQFVVAFGNSIMAEISRLASIYESRQKGDFIGSISHELRSPLHGILGSAEFLSETDFDAFQGSLVDTISSCGRTLLDTIEHILDFSKINSFERNWRNARKPRAGRLSSDNEMTRSVAAKEAPPMMSIYAVTDVAAIVEEVVEGVYAGEVYKDFGSADIADLSAGQSGKTSDRGLPTISKSLLGGSVERKNFRNIEIILDIEEGNFVFVTQPGALRRVVMNVFGNSLKYTAAGKVVVKLRLDPPELLPDNGGKNKILDITVTDTGRGIASDYLRTNLYTAFSQEDVLANGTGLGLSIVRSIVSLLEGTIDIKSQVGRGTEVHIRIPLSREAGGETPNSTPSSVGSFDKLQGNSISVLQAEYSSKRISIYDVDGMDLTAEPETETSRMSLYYVKTWFKLAIESRPLERPADVIIVKEGGLQELLKRLQPGPAIVVLCGRTFRLQAAQFVYPGSIEFMSTPFGPYKLAKAIRLSLEKAKDIALGLVPRPVPPAHSPPSSQLEIASPNLESLTLETDSEATPMKVHTKGVLTASQSNNAQMALGIGMSQGEFPFPKPGNIPSGSESPRSGFDDVASQYLTRPKVISRRTEPLCRTSSSYTSTLTRQGMLATLNARTKVEGTIMNSPISPLRSPTTSIQREVDPISNSDGMVGRRPPRLLLVDDNNINLRLLQTFMRKRKYQLVDSAVNGNLADLSMPVMNGFEATRAIRELERRRDPSRDAQQPRKAAMIIALTGLASGRDHGDAFACGVDLYMTKPVSFKEVGRLLDNWEAHGGLEEAPRAAPTDGEKD